MNNTPKITILILAAAIALMPGLTFARGVFIYPYSGTVNSVEASNVTFTARNGSMTYTTDVSKAKLINKKGVTIQLSDVKIGDYIVVSAGGGITNVSTGGKQASATTTISNATMLRDMSIVGAAAGISPTASPSPKPAHSGKKESEKENTRKQKIGHTQTSKKEIVTISGILTAKTDNGLAVTGGNGTIYDIDISGAKLLPEKGGKTGPTLNIGDKLLVMGKYKAGSTTDIIANSVKDLSLMPKTSKKHSGK